jgi:hypothetical protein
MIKSNGQINGQIVGQIIGQIIGHISFDISHLTFLRLASRACPARTPEPKQMSNEKCQMVYDQ